jgi:plastocyanin
MRLTVLCALAVLFTSSNAFTQTGAIHGKVNFKGALPKLDRATCITPDICGATHSYDRLVVGKDRGVEYALVYLKNPPVGKASFPLPVIKQENCTFEPHMQLASRGLQITFENSDPVLHNCHGYSFVGTDKTTIFNVAQPLKGQKSQETLRKPGMVNIECDAGHTWMSAWVWVSDSPFAAVSEEHGSFTIANVPPGTYTLVMWHEGWKSSGMRDGRPVFSSPVLEERQITVLAGANTEANFELQ